MRERKLLLPMIALGLLLGGCATTKSALGKKPSVDDSDLARLPAGSLDTVNQQRAKVSQANDNVSREEVGVKDAKNGVDAAKSEEKVAKQEENAGNARLKAARDANDASAEKQAQAAIDNARAKETVAKSHTEASIAAKDLADAKLTLAKRQLDLEKAQLEKDKLYALKNSGQKSARNYAPAEFDKEVRTAQDDVAAAKRDVDSKQIRSDEAYASWQRAQRRYTATSSPPPG